MLQVDTLLHNEIITSPLHNITTSQRRQGFEMLLDLLAPLSDDQASSDVPEDDGFLNDDLADDDDDQREENRREGGGDGNEDGREKITTSASVSEMITLARYYASHAAASSSPLPLIAPLPGHEFEDEGQWSTLASPVAPENVIATSRSNYSFSTGIQLD